jgi:hypothetical protein
MLTQFNCVKWQSGTLTMTSSSLDKHARNESSGKIYLNRFNIERLFFFFFYLSSIRIIRTVSDDIIRYQLNNRKVTLTHV